MHFTQNGLVSQMQEPIELEQWAAGQTHSTTIELSNIDRVPVSLIHAISDETVDVTGAEWTYVQIQSKDKHIRFEHGGHMLFAYETKSSFTDRMVETIETGNTVDAGTLSFTYSGLSAMLLITVSTALV